MPTLAKFMAMPPPIVPAPMMPTLPDRDRRRVLRHVGNLPHLAFGEEHVALRGRLRALHQLHEQFALGCRALHRTADSPPPRCSGCCIRERESRGTCGRWPCGTRRRFPACRARRRPCRSGRALSSADVFRRRPSSRTRSRRRAVRLPARSHRRARRCARSLRVDVLAGRHHLERRSGPTMRGRRCVPPAPGNRPRFTSGRPHFAEGTATR